jgi:hypothetical protein
VPSHVVRDCCATFIVHIDRVLRLPRSFFIGLGRKMRNQPSPSLFLEHDISLYMERFWRFLWQPTRYDFERDFSQVRCRQRNAFYCLPTSGDGSRFRASAPIGAMVANSLHWGSAPYDESSARVDGEDDLRPEIVRRGCAPYGGSNIFS